MVERPNRAVLNDALDEYRDAMRPFIVRAMKRIKGKVIEDAIYDSLSSRQASEFERRLRNNGDNVEGAIDIGDFRNLISRNWRHVFSQQFGGDMNIRDSLGIIARARNKVSHPGTEDLDAKYTFDALYHIVEVLGEINAPDARAKVEGFLNKLLQPEESNPLILDLPDDTKAERSIYKESGSKPWREVIPPNLELTSPDPSTPKSEKYQTYFQSLLDEMREQHNFTKALCVKKGQNYYSFASGFTGITYGARFPNTGTVYTQLKIDFGKGKKKTTKKFFDVLKERESEINARFDEPLYWDRRDDIGASRIYIKRDGTIESNESDLAAFRAWHVENLLKFKEVFTPEIQLALEKLRSSEIEPE